MTSEAELRSPIGTKKGYMTNRNKGREVRRPINIKPEINNAVHNFVLLRFAVV